MYARSIAHAVVGDGGTILTSTGRQSWVYDGNGNILTSSTNGLTTTYGYSAAITPNEVMSVTAPGQPSTVYGYDATGDTTAITNGSSITTSLGYDSQARPVTVTLGDGTQAVFGYNAQGQRSSYTVTKGGATLESEQFSYRSDELGQAVISNTQKYTDTYLYNAQGAPLELLRQRPGTTDRYWYELDGRGNVVAVTDVHGNAVDRYAYDVWGRLVGSSETTPQRLRYGGYWWDAELGWYWVSVRSYDPLLKRWLQPDPSQQDGVRTYVYVGDNPIDATDPTGLDNPIPCFLNTPGKPLICEGKGSSYQTSAVMDTMYNAFIGDDLNTLSSGVDIKLKALAAADIVLIVVPIEKIIKGVVIGAKAVKDIVKSVAVAHRIAHASVSLSVAERAVLLLHDVQVTRLARQLKFTTTTIRHQAEFDRRVPLYLLADAILHGRRVPDPQAAEGAVKIIMDDFSFAVTINKDVIVRTGKRLVIIYREADKTILHYDYYNK